MLGSSIGARRRPMFSWARCIAALWCSASAQRLGEPPLVAFDVLGAEAAHAVGLVRRLAVELGARGLRLRVEGIDVVDVDVETDVGVAEALRALRVRGCAHHHDGVAPLHLAVRERAVVVLRHHPLPEPERLLQELHRRRRVLVEQVRAQGRVREAAVVGHLAVLSLMWSLNHAMSSRPPKRAFESAARGRSRSRPRCSRVTFVSSPRASKVTSISVSLASWSTSRAPGSHAVTVAIWRASPVSLSYTSSIRPPTPGSILMPMARTGSTKLCGPRRYQVSISVVKMSNAMAASTATWIVTLTDAGWVTGPSPRRAA